MTVKFRASSVGNLLVGGNAITDRQLQKLAELELRHDDPEAKPLTARMLDEMKELATKRDNEFEFGATAKNYIVDCWLRDNYGYDEPVMTNEIVKGLLCEEQSIGVLTRQVEGEFRVKNDIVFENDWFTGTPDIVGDQWVEDVKTSWSLRTFVAVERPSPIYHAQGQVYMDLTGCSFFRLAHVLVPTPPELIEEEKKRFYFRFNCDENSPYYRECVRKVDAMHAAVSMIPERERIKTFVIERHDGYLATLRQRVEQARAFYSTLSLNWRSDDE